MPPGFRASLYAKFETANVRGLALGPSGVLFVSRPQDGAIDLLVDGNQDGFAEVRDQVLSGLDCPHGLAVSGGWLYAAQMHRVERFPLSGGNGRHRRRGTVAPAVTVGRQGELLADDLPDGPCADHGYRSIAVDPAKNSLYVGVGMLCNVCIEEGPGAEKLATVRRYPLPSPGTAAPAATAPGAPARPGAEHASGMRNVVGMALNPWDGTLWGGNVERDEQGDDEPPEQITRIPAGGDFGWPHCYWTRDGAWRTETRVPGQGAVLRGVRT